MVSAKLIKPYVAGLRLNGAVFDATTFIIPRSLDGPSDIIGLDELVHRGPLWISIDTLLDFRDELPTPFLLGCGMRQEEIEYFRTVIGKANRFHDYVFISYSHTDSTFVDKLEPRLEKEGIRVYRDTEHLVAGDLQDQIEHAIRSHRIVLVVLSKQSITSDWVEHELAMVRIKEKDERRPVRCPVALDDSWKAKKKDTLWHQIEKKYILDFSKRETEDVFEARFQKLLQGMKKNYEPAPSTGGRPSPEK